MAKIKKSGSKPTSGGPYLAAAVFCDNVMRDEGGAMSAIRIVDRLTLTLPADAPPDVPSPTKQVLATIQGLIAFKTGYSGKRHSVSLVLHSPSKKFKALHDREVDFREEAHGGFSLRLNTTLAISEAGLYWVDVRLDGKLMTRMPLLVVVKREDAVPSDGSPAEKTPKKTKARRAK